MDIRYWPKERSCTFKPTAKINFGFVLVIVIFVSDHSAGVCSGGLMGLPTFTIEYRLNFRKELFDLKVCYKRVQEPVV